MEGYIYAHRKGSTCAREIPPCMVKYANMHKYTNVHKYAKKMQQYARRRPDPAAGKLAVCHQSSVCSSKESRNLPALWSRRGHQRPGKITFLVRLEKPNFWHNFVVFGSSIIVFLKSLFDSSHFSISIFHISPLSRVRRWKSWMCWPMTSSSICFDLPTHPVFSSLRWTFFVLDRQHKDFYDFRKTRTRLRLRQRGRASTLSPSTRWTAVQTSTVSSPSDPSLPSSSKT